MPKQVITATETEIALGLRMDALAAEWASKIDTITHDDISALAKAKTELEGGAFTVLFHLRATFGEDGLNSLPDNTLPDKEQRAGNNPAIYKVRKITRSVKGKVTVTVKEVHFRDRLTAQLPSVVRCNQLIDYMTRANSEKQETRKDDIPPEIADMGVHARVSKIGELTKYVNQAHDKVGNALDLHQQWQRAKMYPNLAVDFLYAITDDGKGICDGKEGRPLKIAPVLSPISMYSTLPGAADMGYKRLLGPGQFKKYNFRQATEKGGTWDTLMNSVPKTENTPDGTSESATIKIETSDRAVAVMNDLASFLWAQKESTSNTIVDTMNKLMDQDTEEGNEFFFNAYVLARMWEGKTMSPEGAARFQKLLNAYGMKHPTHVPKKAA